MFYISEKTAYYMKWPAEQIIAVFDNLGAGLEWQFEKAGLGAGSKAEANEYQDRFNSQWKASWRLITSTSPNSPIYQIIKLLLENFIKRYGYDIAKKELAKLLPKLAIQTGTKMVVSSVLIVPIVRNIVSTAIFSTFARKAVTFFASLGVGLYITEQGMVNQSSLASWDLKLKNPALYNELYKHNLETFWFLIPPYISKLAGAILR